LLGFFTYINCEIQAVKLEVQQRLSDILVLAYELGKKNCVPAVQMFNLVMPIISAVVSLKNVPLSFYLWSNQKKNDAFFLPTTESVLTSQK